MCKLDRSFNAAVFTNSGVMFLSQGGAKVTRIPDVANIATNANYATTNCPGETNVLNSKNVPGGSIDVSTWGITRAPCAATVRGARVRAPPLEAHHHSLELPCCSRNPRALQRPPHGL